MNLLVTGGLGHIGSKLIRHYSSREDVELIRIFDNLSTQRYCSLFDLPRSKRYEFIEGDVRDPKGFAPAFEGIDTVIHLAAITDAPATIDNETETSNVNFEGTINALRAAESAGVKKFLFPSTTSVYGEAEGLVDELSPNLKPATPYAISKLEAEKTVSSFPFSTTSDLETVILRKGTIFGNSIGMRFHTAVNKFAYLAALGLPLTLWEDALDQKRPYLGLDDSIRAYEFLELSGEPRETYNVLTGNYTVRDVIDTIGKFVPNVNIEMTKSPILNQKSYEVSDEKIRSLGFVPQDNLESQIGATIELFRGIRNDRR
ncbi:nucleoside-diphosphate sugar epimerase [Candidatus Pacearchaeota archaeon]|nr:nucleoside-diphosphate sugar epimerase [Candidatus Pacearchaeota archaeon]|tara:strand:- start:300 stop:1247 length:948 start_codon:yes stop_codon:yes gene_type:complete